MEKSNQYFMETRESALDVDDFEYFELLREAEWKDYMQKKEEEYRKAYGNGAMFNLMWKEFLNKNNEL